MVIWPHLVASVSYYVSFSSAAIISHQCLFPPGVWLWLRTPGWLHGFGLSLSGVLRTPEVSVFIVDSSVCWVLIVQFVDLSVSCYTEHSILLCPSLLWSLLPPSVTLSKGITCWFWDVSWFLIWKPCPFCWAIFRGAITRKKIFGKSEQLR